MLINVGDSREDGAFAYKPALQEMTSRNLSAHSIAHACSQPYRLQEHVSIHMEGPGKFE